MLIQTYPKPPPKKKKKAKNNPKPTEQDRCIVCGKPYASMHEVFYGKNRQNSIEYGTQVRLCYEHHTGQLGVHNNPDFNLKLKQQGQVLFELCYSHEEFMQIYGRDYLNLTLEEFIRIGAE